MTPVSLKQHGDIMQDFRRVHFVGIGGVGMSGIAEVLRNLGYSVSGSDKADQRDTRRLASLGARIDRGHDAKNVAGRRRARRVERDQAPTIPNSSRRARGAFRSCRARKCSAS